MRTKQSSTVLRWIDRNFGKVGVAVIVSAIALALVGAAVADTAEPSYDPTGEIYDLDARAEEAFGATADIRSATFLVDREDGGNVLTRDVLAEVLAGTAHARAGGMGHLSTVRDQDLDLEVDGILSIADAVDAALPTGIQGATEAEFDRAVETVLAPDSAWSGLRRTLPETAAGPSGADGAPDGWVSSVFQVAVRYDITTFDGVDDIDRDRNAELWMREVSEVLQDNTPSARVVGVAIDPILTGEEQVTAGGPYIFLAVGLIVLLVGALMRSYWAAVVVASGLGVSMLLYNAALGLLGVNTGSALIVFVIPVTLIAFGVDFFVHATERLRESAASGPAPDYPRAMSAALPALALAAATSVAAFASNVVGEIQAIVQFGIAASIGLLTVATVLGILTPRALLAAERRVGAARRGRRSWWRGALVVPVAVIAGSVVAMTALVPPVGAVALPVFILAFVVLPTAIAGRRARVTGAVGPTGSHHGRAAERCASAVSYVARKRLVTLPVTLGVALLGLAAATQVESAFRVSDFFAPDTEFVTGIERLDTHFGEATGGPAYVYVEGDLTEPGTLAALDRALARIDSSDAALARDHDGGLVVTPNATTLVRATMATDGAAARVAELTGTAVDDADGDGLPDTGAAVDAIYATALSSGIRTADGAAVFAPEQVRSFLWTDGAREATRLEVLVTSFTDDALILEARQVLEDAADDLRRDLGDSAVTVGVSGDVIASQDSLAAFTRAMVVSLPLAIVLTVLIVAVSLRSVRYSVLTIVPILVVVFCVWGYMWLRGLTVNVVTATIAAIAVGVGIDYSTHFTMRFREVLARTSDPITAVGRTAAGTGSALAVSAMTSVLGFGVMAMAPAPIFASFGELMAVTIVLSLIASLVVLPCLLVVVASAADRRPPAADGDPGERSHPADRPDADGRHLVGAAPHGSAP